MITRLRYYKGYQFFDGNGAPLALGRLFYFGAGTTAPQDTFSDGAGTVPNTNPVILDGSGRLSADVYLGSSADYKELLTDGTGAAVSPWPDDNIVRGGQADWNAISGPSQILNRPTLAAIATTGSYNDLLNKPVIAAAPSDMVGDSGTGGTHGLVPAPPAGSTGAGKFLKADGTWAAPPSTGGASDMIGATPTAAGTHGLVPGPAAGQQASFLRGDATWATPPFTQANADWNATSGVAQILNKPTLGTAAAQNTPSSGNASPSQVVLGSDTRLSDSRSPIPHAATHAAGGSDPLSISASQVSGIPAALSGQNVDNIGRLGIGTTDAGNKLSVSAPTVLFSNSGDMRATISKGAVGNTAAFNFQDNFSTRVQFGLLGNDDFTIATSPDGSAFQNGLVIDSSGAASFPNSSGFAGDAGSGGAVGLVPAPPAGAAAASKFLKADGTWALPASGGGTASDMIGASSGTNGAHGLVIQPNAGQQNLFLRGDASWADPGAVLSHFSFRDANISGFTGARWEMYQLGGSSNSTTGSASAATFPIANNEIILIRLDWIMALSDLSKSAAGSLSKAFKKVSSTITTLSTGTPTTDTMKDGSQAVFMSISNLTASTIDLVVLSDSTANTYNWFANVRVLHMQTNS